MGDGHECVVDGRLLRIELPRLWEGILRHEEAQLDGDLVKTPIFQPTLPPKFARIRDIRYNPPHFESRSSDLVEGYHLVRVAAGVAAVAFPAALDEVPVRSVRAWSGRQIGRSADRLIDRSTDRQIDRWIAEHSSLCGEPLLTHQQMSCRI